MGVAYLHMRAASTQVFTVRFADLLSLGQANGVSPLKWSS